MAERQSRLGISSGEKETQPEHLSRQVGTQHPAVQSAHKPATSLSPESLLELLWLNPVSTES